MGWIWLQLYFLLGDAPIHLTVGTIFMRLMPLKSGKISGAAQVPTKCITTIKILFIGMAHSVHPSIITGILSATIEGAWLETGGQCKI